MRVRIFRSDNTVVDFAFELECDVLTIRAFVRGALAAIGVEQVNVGDKAYSPDGDCEVNL